MEANRKEEGSEIESAQEEQREMDFEEVLDFFAQNKHLPESEDYDVIDLYENFDEYKNLYYDQRNDTITGADTAFFADLEQALKVSYEIENEIREED